MILEYRLKSNKNSRQMVNKCKAQHVNHHRLHASHRRLATGLSATFAGCVMRTVSLDLAGIETPAFGAPNCSTRVQSAEWTSTISSTLTINWRICCWINKPRVSVLHIPAGLSFCEVIIDWRRWLIVRAESLLDRSVVLRRSVRTLANVLNLVLVVARVVCGRRQHFNHASVTRLDVAVRKGANFTKNSI